MKVQFSECDYYGEILLIPETIEEVAGLLRFSRNASAIKPDVYMSFNSNEPYCNIYIQKRKISVQVNSISPKTK